MSQVKKSNRPKAGLTAIAISLLTVVTVFMAGCKDQNAPLSLVGNKPQPTWQAPAEYDLSTSMTVILKVSLTPSFTEAQLVAANYQHSADDRLAAFEGETCLGVGEYKAQYNAYWLYIDAPQNGDKVTIKYYSAALKNIFVATEALVYSSHGMIGSISEPYTPLWVIE